MFAENFRQFYPPGRITNLADGGLSGQARSLYEESIKICWRLPPGNEKEKITTILNLILGYK